MRDHAFKTGMSRDQASFLPARIDDYVGPDSPVRAIEAYVEAFPVRTQGGAPASGTDN